MQIPESKKHRSLIVRDLLVLILAPIGIVAGLLLILIVWMRTMHIDRFREKIIRFNKQTLNPTTLKIAGGRSSVYAAIKHTGRRSGRTYTTPVVAKPLGDGFVIPLPYGSRVDWCQNVSAAGACTLIWNDQEYTLERPELIGQSQALKAFPPGSRVLYPLGGLKEYLWLHQGKEISENTPTDSVPQLVGVE